MKLVFLNIWHGFGGNGLYNFIESQSAKTDIFCFCEVHPELHRSLQAKLSDFEGHYEQLPRIDHLGGVIEGQSIFLRKGIKYLGGGKKYLYRINKKDTGCLQYADIDIKGHKLSLANEHGKAMPGHKLDTPARILQSKKILDLFKNKEPSQIIIGDFNLMPETLSVRLFEKAGYRNLIKDYNIKNTRNRLSWEQFKQKKDFEKQNFADYCFTKNIKVTNFEVPYMEISDHNPLILEFEL